MLHTPRVGLIGAWPHRLATSDFDLASLIEEDVAPLGLRGAGVYVLVAYRAGKDTAPPFQYPLRPSPVFYIGKANIGSRRLFQHQTQTAFAYQVLDANALRLPRERRHQVMPHSRYTYAAVFGAQVFWFPAADN